MDGLGGTGESACKAMGEADELEALRARAVCAEVLAGVGEGHGMTTALLRRLGALTDPERVEDANMLAGWREKYRRKITVRTKSMVARARGGKRGMGNGERKVGKAMGRKVEGRRWTGRVNPAAVGGRRRMG